jgi:hypothetical protein
MALGACHPCIKHDLLTQCDAFAVLRMHLLMMAETATRPVRQLSAVLVRRTECAGQPFQKACQALTALRCVQICFSCCQKCALSALQTPTLRICSLPAVLDPQVQKKRRLHLRTWGMAPRSLHLLNPCNSSSSFTIKAPCSNSSKCSQCL